MQRVKGGTVSLLLGSNVKKRKQRTSASDKIVLQTYTMLMARLGIQKEFPSLTIETHGKMVTENKTTTININM